MASHGFKPDDKTYRDETIESVPSGDYTPPKQLTTGQKLKNHFRRFWWLHLILFVVGFVVIFLILLFVGFPNIAQQQLDAAKFELLEQEVWAPTPDQVYMRMVTLSTSKSPYHPKLDAFNTSLFLESTEPDIIPFAYFESPETQVLSKTHITISTTLPIANMEQFIAYNKMVFTSETFRVGVRGRTSLHQGTFPATKVNFNKVVSTKGLNSLKGFKVANFSISVTPDADGSNLKGFVYIPNPSVMTLTFGTVVQDTYVDGVKIGNTTIDNMVLKPGDNYLPMRGSSDQGAVINAISTKYKDGVLPITVVGNSVMYNGKHIPYYEEALKTTNLTASLNVGKALKDIGLGGLLPGGDDKSSSASASSSTAPAFPAPSSSGGFGPFPAATSSAPAQFPAFPAPTKA